MFSQNLCHAEGQIRKPHLRAVVILVKGIVRRTVGIDAAEFPPSLRP